MNEKKAHTPPTAAEKFAGARHNIYDHGGSRMFFVDANGERELLIDFYHEDTREFFMGRVNGYPALVAQCEALRADMNRILARAHIVHSEPVAAIYEIADIASSALSMGKLNTQGEQK